ncbi:hypothetical protein D9758_001085 [Tetrapyrgos nigripes]|uniref:RNA polymerase II elongation factor ELL N-terminal domain-containing protein n=1 Tax=Tetrapyrgos nigripes TaxID=182062 RepID=A0A8H5GRR2_9AGAR|nr:hypothetical protein D9758_001085 [Tetrapyrgos nigripes]
MPGPLPAAVHALHGHSRPGDVQQPNKKHSYIVRLSMEALSALDTYPNQPEMEFQFGDNPGFFIGDSFFPVHQQKEEICHDLYLRMATAAKPNVPLKLYANVTGKLTVPERELDKSLQDRIRKSTADAASQRSAAKTKFIDSPADLPAASTGKKKKEASMFRKPVNPKIPDPSKASRPLPLPSSLPPRPQPSLSSTSQSSQRPSSDPHLRNRLVHFLAVGERTSDETIKAVAGADAGADLKGSIFQLLEEVAEQLPQNGSKRMWRLKPKTWMEVRPYEWPRLSDVDRTRMAREARMALKALNIPETDPAWAHVKYRATGPPDGTTRTDSPIPRPSPLTNEAAPAPVPKKGVSSKDAKEKKARVKNDTKEIMMKDESKPRVSEKVVPPEKVNRSNSNSSSVSSSNAASVSGDSRLSPTVTTARKPGSGYKLTKSTDVSRSRSPMPQAASSSKDDVRKKDAGRRTDGKATPNLAHRQAARDVEVKMRDDTRRSGEVKGRRDVAGETYATQSHRVKQLKEEDKLEPRRKEKAVEKPRAQDTNHRLDASLKRKKDAHEDDDYQESSNRTSGQKKRKTLDERDRASLASSSSRDRPLHKPSAVDNSRVSNIEVVAARKPPKELSPLPAAPLPKIKKGPSPVPPIPIASSVSSSSTSSRNSNAKASGKSRRRSPIYTSSEDEGEITSSNSRSTPLSRPTPNVTVNDRHSHSRNGALPEDLPRDSASLRARYTEEYVEYLKPFQMALDQKSKIQRLLKNFPDGSDGSVTDDSGLELMDAESLSRIVGESKKHWQELQNIQKAYENLG